MGVKGLWPIIASAASEQNLVELAVREGFDNVQDGRAYQLGIDIRHQAVSQNRTEHCPPTVLSALGLPPVTFCCGFFVFEGAEQPNIKRGKHIIKKGHLMKNSAEYLIEAFGFKHSTALGEAKAELSAMNAAGLLNAVVTNDVDAFLLRGLTVMRMWNIKKDKGTVTTYNIADIKHNVCGEITRDGMILLSLLSGGDYNSGLTGCGVQTALGVVKYGLGTTLCAAARVNDVVKFTNFLVGWRDHLHQILQMDPRNLIGRRNHLCTRNITDAFPDVKVLHAYLNPLFSVSHGNNLSPPTSQLPHVARIGQLCERYFEWATPGEILPQFLKHVWPGVILRMILEDVLKVDAVRGMAGHFSNAATNPSIIPDVIRSHTFSSGIPECKVRFPTAKLTAATLSSLQELQQPLSEGSSDMKKPLRDEIPLATLSDHLEVWIPSTIFHTWVTGDMSDALLMTDDGPPADEKIDLTSPTPPPCHSHHHHAESKADTNTSSTVNLATPPAECESSHCTRDFADDMIIDLTDDGKVIYDLTGI